MPGGLVKSNVLFVMFGTSATGVALLLFFSTCFTARDEYTGERILWSFSGAGTLSYFLMLGGAFAFYSQARARAALDSDLSIGSILHPSPASPAANRGWAEQVDKQLSALGVDLP